MADQLATAELRMLGGFELRIRGERIDLQPGIQRLLAFVALAPRGVERTFAAFQLWPDKDEKRARANLRSALWRLGKLNCDLLQVTKSRIGLAGDVWVDAQHGIESLQHDGDTAIIDGMLPFQVLTSEVLPDWYDDWLLVERERLRQLSLAALERHARGALDRGDTARAIQSALSAVALDPMRESGHRIVIEAHLIEGNDSEAHRQLSHYRAALACDSCLTVSPGLEALLERDLPVSA